MSNIGRRSVFSKEFQNEIAKSGKKKSKESINGIVIDICHSNKPESKFLNKSFEKGITLIFICYETYKIYSVAYKKDIAILRGIEGGTDENIIGREITVFSNSSSYGDVHDGQIEFNGQRIRKTMEDSVPEYKSLSFFSNMYTDYESQIKSFKHREEVKGEYILSIGDENES